MPYIAEGRRAGAKYTPTTEGELNYAITHLILEWLPRTPCYADFNAAVGVLESAKLEFYRRMIAPYEDKKCKENGEVYPIEG